MKPKKASLFNPVFIGVFIADLMFYTGQGLINSLVTKYADYLGASSSLVGTVASLFALTAFVVKVFCGPATVSFNKKSIAICATSIVCAAYTLFAISNSVPMLILARLVQGVGVGFVAPIMLAIASDSLPKEKLGAGIGYFSVIQVVAQAFSPGIALKLMPIIGYHLVFATGAVLLAGATILIFCLKIPDTRTEKIPFRIKPSSILARECVIPVILMTLTCMAMASCDNFVILYSESVGVADISVYFTINAVLLFISRPLSANISDKIGARNILLPAFFVFGLSMLGFTQCHTLAGFLALGAIYSLALGCCQPTLQALCIKSVSSDRRGVASNSSYLGNDAGSFLGPIAAGIVAESFGYQGIYFAAAIYPFLAFITVLLSYKKIKAIDLGINGK